MVYAGVVILTSPVWAYRLLRTGKWRTPWSERFGWCDPCPEDGRATLLIHAVSVGEVNAIQRLVSTLGRQCHLGTLRIVISTTTDTGAARARQLFEPRHRVVRYPFDLGPCVKRFLDAVRPDAVALTELEVWPTFLDECSRRGVPVCVINGRLSTRSFRRYRRIRALLRPTFAKLVAVAAQTPQYAQRFVALGVPDNRVRVIDSMKWDTGGHAADGVSGNAATADTDDRPQDRQERVQGAEALGHAMGIDPHRPLVVAGSTGPGEEKMLIHGCPTDAQLVVAPRKPERFDEVAGLWPGLVRRSQHPDGGPAPKAGQRIFLLDTIGELAKAYALADVAIVGRSFLGGQHGSNPMEPVALGKPTIIGPYHDDFTDIVEALRQRGGIVVTHDPCQAAAELLADRQRASELAQRGIDVIHSRQGTTESHADLLLQLMPLSVQASLADHEVASTAHVRRDE